MEICKFHRPFKDMPVGNFQKLCAQIHGWLPERGRSAEGDWRRDGGGVATELEGGGRGIMLGTVMDASQSRG